MGGSSTTSRNKVHLTMYRRCGRDRGSDRNAVMYRLRHVPRCTEPEKWWAAVHSCAQFDFGQLSASALGVAVLLGIQVQDDCCMIRHQQLNNRSVPGAMFSRLRFQTHSPA